MWRSHDRVTKYRGCPGGNGHPGGLSGLKRERLRPTRGSWSPLLGKRVLWPDRGTEELPRVLMLVSEYLLPALGEAELAFLP